MTKPKPARGAGPETLRDGSIRLVNPSPRQLVDAFAAAYRAAGALPHLIPALAAREARHVGVIGLQGHGGDALVSYVHLVESGRRHVRVYPAGHVPTLRPVLRAMIHAD
jgi:hypothetical protein